MPSSLPNMSLNNQFNKKFMTTTKNTIYKIPKELKKSYEVFQLLKKVGVKDCLVEFKGGIGIVRDFRVKEIYVGETALADAKKAK